MDDQARIKADLVEALKRSNDLLGALSETQDLYIAGVDTHTLFDVLLTHIISLTESTYGFIGEVLYTAEGAPYLRTYAVTNIAWNDATREYYEEFSSKGMEFYNLKTLFGTVLATGMPVISNDPATDPRRGGLPDGHPPMHAFLGIPIHHGGDFCGMVGIANRAGGYTEEVIEYLRPFLTTCGSLIDAKRASEGRRRAEQALRESEEKYRELVETANSVILTWDTTGNIVFVNRFAEQFFGFTREELLGRNVVGTIVPPTESSGRDLSLLMREIERNPDQFRDNENENITRDGRRVWVRWANKAVLDGEGKLIGILSIGNDITERKEAAEKNRQSEQFIRNILDTVDEGFLVIDREYQIVTANKAYCAQVDMPCEDVIGKHCYEVSHKTHRPCFLEGEDCAARHVFATGAPRTATHQHRDAHGGIVFVETKCFPIKDDSGAVTSVIETIDNITERRLLEEERLKTQKLESIGTLAGGIAHDFNNLLQGVFGYISMAKLTFDQREKSQAMLEQAEKALHLSVNLTTQLLTFSKGGKPVKKRTALLPVIENAAKFALSGSRSEYRITSDPGLWQVDADQGQLGQVIQNIVLNADQAMPLGGSVVISARNLPASDEARPQVLGKRDHVLVSIQDTGAGMSQEYLGRIFDPYFTTKEKGSGLGLATSYSIIRNHDGLIDVKSGLGKGSTFLIYLPAAATIEKKPRKEAAPAGVRVGRILVMDDEELVRNVAGELLATLGHTAAFVDKGETALEVYRSSRESGRPFDIVILDLTIRGGMGGEETFLKLLEIDPNVKAVVSSGYSDDATLANYRQAGFKAFLKKPYDMHELQSTLDALLTRA